MAGKGGESSGGNGAGGAGVDATGGRPARVEWVDAAKGVGILLVIAGHVWWRPGMAHQLIYAFHMPLFFLLSGYMVTPQPAGPLLVRQARSLLVPFAAFSVLLVLADVVVEGARGGRPMFPSLVAGLWAIVARTDRVSGPFTILWFVPCLFLARLVWNAIAARVPDPADRRWPLLVVVLMTAASCLAPRIGASPLGIMAVPAALTLFWVGQLWRARPPGGLTLMLLVPLALATLLVLPPVNLKVADYGLPVLGLGGGAAVSILLCRLLAALPDAAQRPLAALGRVSLVIMFVHVAFIHYLTPYLGRPLLFAAALAGSLATHGLAAATRPGRAILLGRWR